MCLIFSLSVKLSSGLRNKSFVTGNFADNCFSACAQVTFQGNVFVEGIEKCHCRMTRNNKDTLVTVETKY